jgi:hypothetical protein
MSLRRLSGCLVGGLLALGCMRDYKPPTADQPHAILKVRRTYENVAGATLSELVTIDEFRGFGHASSAREGADAHTDALLIHPAPVTIGVTSEFSHMEERMVQETYYEQESYMASESYSCGTGTSYQSCTRSVTRYRSVPRTRMVMRSVPVSDGACRSAFRLAPAVGAVYLMQYTYRQSSVCSLSCFEQLTPASSPPGQIEQRPCPVAPPAAD